MYICIDRDNMQFLAKHQNNVCLSHLANIEAAHVSVLIAPCDEPRDFMLLTDLELRLLFKHVTGNDPQTAHRPLMLAHCVALAQQVPEREINAFEVEVQSNSIPDDDKTGRYRYVPGATRPQRCADLFEPERLTCAQGWSAERVAEFAKQAPQPPIAAAATHAPAPQRSPAARPAGGAAATPAAPRGGGRQAIWAHMDALWEKAGKPTDVKVVLALRKTCMDELEPQGFKRTSASSELGNWMKARCPQ
jgi:hypothetical protein